MKKWKEIEEIIQNKAYSKDDDIKSLVEKISIYHEELIFQNEELKRINEYLEKIKNDYQNLFYSAPVAYFVVDNFATILESNHTANKLFGKVLAKKITKLLVATSKNDFYLFLHALFNEDEARTNVSFMKDHSSIHMEVIGKKISSEQNRYLITCIDFEKHYNNLKEINTLSYTDYLTGLHNRRFFEKHLREIRGDLLPVSVISADVNGLKVLNDAFGHNKGDELLKETAKIMLEHSVPEDIIARIGGDEFAILCTKTSSKEAQELINNYRKAFSKLKVNDINFSLSFGSATINSMVEDIDEIIGNAEQKMYQDKITNEYLNGAKIVESILQKLWKKHPSEEIHSKKVAKYMKQMAQYLNYDEDRVKNMELAGLMHNIGKITNENTILSNSVMLSASEFGEIRKHPEVAYRILKSSSKYSKIAYVILYHHEWVDGNGYPKGLTGKDIPFFTKVLSVCEAYSAMTSDRPYRSAMTKEDAIAELEASVNTQFDKEVVEKFVDMIKAE